MIKRFFVLLVLLISIQSIGQVVQFPTNYGVGYRRTGGDTLLWVPKDTFAVPTALRTRTHIAIKSGVTYYWNGTIWSALAGGGSGVSSVGTGYGLSGGTITTTGTILWDSATAYITGLRRKDSASGTNINGYLTRSNVSTYAPLFGVGDSRANANRSFSLAGNEFLIDSVGTQFRHFGYNDPLFGWYGYNSSGQATSLLENTGAGFTAQNWDRVTGESAELSMLPTRYNISIFHSTGNFYLHNSKESNWMDQIIQNEWTGTGGSTPKFGEFRNVTGANTSGNFFTSMSNNISSYLYNRIILDSVNRISLGTKNSSAATYKGIKIDGSHQVFVDSMATGGVAADSLVVITSGGQLKKRNPSALVSGGTPAGNYGNIQLNRNGAFDTPSSDSLSYNTKTLFVKDTVDADVIKLGKSSGTKGVASFYDAAGKTALITTPDAFTANYTLTLPVDDGNNLEVLQTNGSGGLSWGRKVDSIYRTAGKDSIFFKISGTEYKIKDSIGGGGTPGGSTKQIQYNNAGSFGGASGFEYGNTNNLVSITSPSTGNVPLKVTATTGQTANLSSWVNSNNIARTYIDSGGHIVLNGYSTTGDGYPNKLRNFTNGATVNTGFDFYTGYNLQFFAGSSGASITTNSPSFTLGLPVVIGNSSGSQPFYVYGSSGNHFLDIGFYGGVVLNNNNSTSDFQVKGQTENNLLFANASTNKVGIATSSPNSLFQINGSFATAYASKSVDYTATATDCIIELTATGKTITLPTAASITGRQYTIKLTASGTGTVGTTSSQTIDGSTTYSLSAQYKYVTVVSNGSNWIVTANN